MKQNARNRTKSRRNIYFTALQKCFINLKDCLNLNLVIPQSLQKVLESRQKLPVVVWLHGGYYTYGTSSGNGVSDSFYYDGLQMSSYGNFIFVSVNYRLSSFGFLTTEDENAPGNYAIDDIQNAIYWIIDNADRIGADVRYHIKPTYLTIDKYELYCIIFCTIKNFSRSWLGRKKSTLSKLGSVRNFRADFLSFCRNEFCGFSTKNGASFDNTRFFIQ